MSTSRPISLRSTVSSSQYPSHLHPSDALASPTHHTSQSHSQKSRRRNRSSSRRRRTTPSTQWKKLLWVKQPFPDNYTDENTFLDHLQRNPKLRPYEFWPLVADSTIIVQHLCSVVIFVSCFTGINMGRIAPETVVGWATGGTVVGWGARDWWLRHYHVDEEEEEGEAGRGRDTGFEEEEGEKEEGLISSADTPTDTTRTNTPTADLPAPISRVHSRAPSATPSHTPIAPDSIPAHHPTFMPPSTTPASHTWSPRTTSLLTTAKSSILIYCSLLGLSPILKSLTRSTSSDSIWAMSFWLIALNVFTFDYGADARSKFPASLSTNAALMASTVLASRLPSTTHVFSLTLFSIEVFGLFPVFRRHLRGVSWMGHLILTAALVVVASGGLAMAVSGGGLVMGGVGVVLGSVVCAGGMGVTSWWLIGLQRYKNEIYGPWDPARPVIRGGWD